MTDQAPAIDTLPSTKTLLRSTGIAALVATVLLVVVVLPAEYAIDPTGIGGALGLTKMGEIKTSLATEAEAHAPPLPTCVPAPAAAVAPSPAATPVAAAPAPTPAAPAEPAVAAVPDAAKPGKSDVTKAVLKPGESIEIKLAMKGGARATYTWTTDQGHLNFDMHSDRPGGGYHGYKKGTATAKDEGEFVAAFDGNHGWYWRNRSDVTFTVTLTTAGDYEAVKSF